MYLGHSLPVYPATPKDDGLCEHCQEALKAWGDWLCQRCRKELDALWTEAEAATRPPAGAESED